VDRTIGARKLLTELVKAEQLEVRRLEIVGRDLAQLCETLKRPPTGAELEDWLDDHAQVSELYASASLLDELVDRHLTPPVADTITEARHPELEQQIRDAPACKHVAALALVAERTTLPTAPSNRIEERVGRRLADTLLASIEDDAET